MRHKDRFRAARLRAEVTGAVGSARIALDPAPEAPVLLELSPLHPVEVLVLARSDREPIEDVTVRYRAELNAAAASTDVRGVARLAVASTGGGELRVEAPGYAPVFASIDGDALTVLLSEHTALHVAVAGRDGDPMRGASVRIAGAAPLFVEDFDAATELGAGTRLASADGRFVVERKATDGDFTIEGLARSRDLSVQLIDGLGNVLTAIELPGDDRASRRVALRAPQSARVFAGAVMDQTGRPLVGAAIVWTTETASWRLRTDREGRFEVLHDERSTARLEVSKAGYASRLVDPFAVEDGRSYEFTLQPR